MFTERRQCTCSVGDIRGGHGDRMGEPLRIHGQMSFDAGYPLPRVVTFLFCRIGILHALRINDHEGCLRVPTAADTDRANHIFLTPAQASWAHRQRVLDSIDESIYTLPASWENHRGAFAIGSRFSIHTELRKKHHINQQLLAWSSSWLARVRLGWTQTALGLYHLGR